MKHLGQGTTPRVTNAVICRIIDSKIRGWIVFRLCRFKVADVISDLVLVLYSIDTCPSSIDLTFTLLNVLRCYYAFLFFSPFFIPFSLFLSLSLFSLPVCEKRKPGRAQMPSLVFWIYTYSSRKKPFPPSSTINSLTLRHSFTLSFSLSFSLSLCLSKTFLFSYKQCTC